MMIPSNASNLVGSCLKLISCFFNPERLDMKKQSMPYPEKIVMVYLGFSLIWSLAANLHDESRRTFNKHFKTEILTLMDFPEGDIYEFGIDDKMHRLQPWQEQRPQFQYEPEKSFFEILVPTSDTVKYKYLLQTLLMEGYNVLLSGETGVGKSVITKDFLSNAANEEDSAIVNAFVNFSGKTTTKNLQDAFEGNLDAKRKNLLGPPGGKKMIFFIDDVNMPQLDRYGSQPPVELLR